MKRIFTKVFALVGVGGLYLLIYSSLQAGICEVQAAEAGKFGNYELSTGCVLKEKK